MTWPNVALFGLLLTAILVGPKLGADPQLLGLACTAIGSIFVQAKRSNDGHADHVDDSPEDA